MVILDELSDNLKKENCHDSYFVFNGGSSDDEVGIMTFGFQCTYSAS